MKLGDSYYGEQRDRLKLKTTDAQDRACAYLEGHDQEFLVDFGYENAIDKAAYLRRQLKMGKPEYPERIGHDKNTR